MERHGHAVGLIADALHQQQCGAAAREGNRIAPGTGHNQLLPFAIPIASRFDRPSCSNAS